MWLLTCVPDLGRPQSRTSMLIEISFLNSINVMDKDPQWREGRSYMSFVWSWVMLWMFLLTCVFYLCVEGKWEIRNPNYNLFQDEIRGRLTFHKLNKTFVIIAILTYKTHPFQRNIETLSPPLRFIEPKLHSDSLHFTPCPTDDTRFTLTRHGT